MSKEDAEKLATDRANEYKVEGYGVTESPEVYGGPYLNDAALDPKVQFAFAGDPEAQNKWRKDLEALDEAKKPKHKKSKTEVKQDKADKKAEPTPVKKATPTPPAKKTTPAKKATPAKKTTQKRTFN